MWEDSDGLKARQMKYPDQANLYIEKAVSWVRSNLNRMGNDC